MSGSRYYDMAKDRLGKSEYLHEEISNWAPCRKGRLSQQPLLDWRKLYWYRARRPWLPTRHGSFWVEIFFLKNWNSFLSENNSSFSDVESWPKSRQAVVESTRDEEDRLLEYVGCGLAGAAALT